MTALIDMGTRAGAEYGTGFTEESERRSGERGAFGAIWLRLPRCERSICRARGSGHHVRGCRCGSRSSTTPTGRPSAETPTFLFTDIEGSTRLVTALGDRYPNLLDEHRKLIADAVETNGGRIFGSEGDALFAAFSSATAAIDAAAAAQRSIGSHDWPEDAEIRVRMGVHTGEAVSIGGDYVGLALHQVARITAAGHGGQVLVSEATRRLATTVSAELELRDLGERRLKDLAPPERLYQLVGEGLDDKFPPLRTLDTKANNLPVQVTSFIGRDELEAAVEALGGTRLLTLTGPGGRVRPGSPSRLRPKPATSSSTVFSSWVSTHSATPVSCRR